MHFPRVQTNTVLRKEITTVDLTTTHSTVVDVFVSNLNSLEDVSKQTLQIEMNFIETLKLPLGSDDRYQHTITGVGGLVLCSEI